MFLRIIYAMQNNSLVFKMIVLKIFLNTMLNVAYFLRIFGH